MHVPTSSISAVCDVSLEDLMRTRLHFTVFKREQKWNTRGEGIKNLRELCKGEGMDPNWCLANSICTHERSAEVLRLMTSIIWDRHTAVPSTQTLSSTFFWALCSPCVVVYTLKWEKKSGLDKRVHGHRGTTAWSCVSWVFLFIYLFIFFLSLSLSHMQLIHCCSGLTKPFDFM